MALKSLATFREHKFKQVGGKLFQGVQALGKSGMCLCGQLAGDWYRVNMVGSFLTPKLICLFYHSLRFVRNCSI